MSVLSDTTLVLDSGNANEITFDAPSNDTLTLAGATPGGVDITGVNNITCSTAFNQGSPLTGLCMAFTGGRAATAAGDYMNFGNGVTDNAGIVMPDNGTIEAWSIGASAAVTLTLSIVINTVTVGPTLSLAAADATSAFISTAFNAGDEVSATCTVGADTPSYQVTFFVRFAI